MARKANLVTFTALLSLILSVTAVNSDLQNKTVKAFEVSSVRVPRISAARAATDLSNKGREVVGTKKTCKSTRCSTNTLTSSTPSTSTKPAPADCSTATNPLSSPPITYKTPTQTPPTNPWTRPSTLPPCIATAATTATTPEGGGGSSTSGSAIRRDIAHNIKLGVEFLKTAARMTDSLRAEDKKNLRVGQMESVSREILSYVDTLSASLDSPTGSWTLRGSRPRPTCTVTSGYWDRKCECELIPKPHGPHGDHGDSDEDDDDDDDCYHHELTKPSTTTTTTMTTQRPRPTRPSRPSYPWHHQHYYPRPEYYYPIAGPLYPHWPQEHHHHHHHHHHHQHGADQQELDQLGLSVDCMFQELACLLDTLSGNASASSNGKKTLRHPTSAQSDTNPVLSLVEKLQSMLANETLTRHVGSSAGMEMKVFLQHKMADLEKMALYPVSLSLDQLGQDGAQQPLLPHVLHSIVDKMESVTSQ